MEKLETVVAQQEKQIKALTAGLEKVRNELTTDKSDLRLVSSAP
jgi:uncharacterized coiled-coil protein SlyX